MGCVFSKESTQSSLSSSINFNLKSRFETELNSYTAGCQEDDGLRSFDTMVQERANRVISTLSARAGTNSISFDSWREVADCLLELNQRVVHEILDSKADIWGNKELLGLVEDYFDNSMHTVEYCVAVYSCSKRARSIQISFFVALQKFEEENMVGEKILVKTLEKLQTFRSACDQFNEDFSMVIRFAHSQQLQMLTKLQLKMKKLAKRAKYTVSVLSTGKWIYSYVKKYEDVLKGREEAIKSMQPEIFDMIKELDSMKNEIEQIMHNGKIAISEETIKMRVKEMKIGLEKFMKTVEALAEGADRCRREILRARTALLQRIIGSTSS